MGSIIMDDVVVGEGSIVGAGAVVPPNMIIPPRSLVVGLPAKIVRQTTDEELEMIIERAQHYIDFSQEYKNQS
jgi:carbonic anhydrase/acetyltransferase-like protein (isoleucine patch superfamily)